MDLLELDKQIRHVVNVRNKAVKELGASLREIHRHQMWKGLGLKSIRQYCEKFLKLDRFQTREVLAAGGLILTEAHLADSSPAAQKRIDALKEWRKQKARKMNVAPYMVLTNRVLLSIAKSNPKSMSELLEIGGMGERKIEVHGREILKCI